MFVQKFPVLLVFFSDFQDVVVGGSLRVMAVAAHRKDTCNFETKTVAKEIGDADAEPTSLADKACSALASLLPMMVFPLSFVHCMLIQFVFDS